MKIDKFRLILVVCGFLIGGAQSVQAQIPKLWGTVSPGSKRVGFKTFEVVDTAHTSKTTAGPRHIKVAEWYPAKKDNAAARMTFGDYVRLSPGSDVPDNMLSAFRKDLVAHGNSDAVIEQLLTAPVYAVHDAAPDDHRSNVIVMALDLDEAPYNQALMAEFYASQGFVVIANQSLVSIDGPPAAGAAALDIAQTQMNDVQAVLNALAADKTIDTKHVGIIGHAFGTRAAYLLLQDPRITALMSLNGDIGNAKSGDWMADALFSYGRYKTSVMAVYETADSVVVPEFRIIQKLANTDRTFVHMGEGFRDVDFGVIGNAKGAIPGFQYGPPTANVLEKIDFLNRLMYGWLLTYISQDGSRFPAGLPKYIRVQRMTAGSTGSPS